MQTQLTCLDGLSLDYLASQSKAHIVRIHIMRSNGTEVGNIATVGARPEVAESQDWKS